MKKIILILTILTSLVFSSCSKGDDTNPNQQLPLTYQNMVGKWYFTSIIKDDGIVQPYPGMCTTVKDYADIIVPAKITTYIHYADCSPAVGPCNSYFFEGNIIRNCLEVFDDAKVTSLTATTMRIEYDVARSFGGIVSGGAKVLILTK